MWLQIALWVVSTVISYALRPKPAKLRPTALDQSNIPVAEEGKEIPVLFGTRDITGPNVVWYGDFSSKAIKKKGGKKG